MSHFWREVFDKRFWSVLIVLIAIGLLRFWLPVRWLVIDPIVWRLIVISSLVLFVVLWVVVTLVLDWRRRRLEKGLRLLERQQEAELRSMLDADPGLKTLCFDCRHHDGNAGCSLPLAGRSSQFHLQGGAAQSYCVYWNFTLPSRFRRILGRQR